MTTADGSTATSGIESFTQSLDKLTFYGSPEVVAAFQIGWEVACLGDQCERDWPEDLDSAARRVIRIESAFADLADLMIATATLPPVSPNVDYSAQLQAYGGTAPYTWSIITTDGLPDGLSLSGKGVISGKAAAADCLFTVRVTDDSTPPNVAQREFTLQMPPNSPTPNTPAPSGAAAATDTVDLFASVRYPTTSSLRDELNAIANRPKATTAEANQEPDAQPDNGSFTTVLGTFDLGLRRALAYAAAAAPLPQAGGGKLATNTAVTSAHGDAYELGVRLANLCLAAETGEPGFTALFTTTGQTDVGAPDTYRIHALLGSLRDSFPSAAAHAVSRNIEDWSAWVQGYPVDTAASNFDSLSGDAGFTACQAAMQAQGKVWESILTGQSRGRDYLTLASYPDAADHLLVAWTGILDSMARTLRKTIFGRTLLILLGVGALLVAFAIAVSFLKTQNPSGAEKTVITVGGVIAALGAAAGIHVNRTQLNSVVSKAWLLAESVLIDSEVIEAIAIATRRLPGEGLEGTAGSRQRTFLSKYRQATAKAHPTKPHRANKTGRTSRLRQAEHKPEENPLALIDSTS